MKAVIPFYIALGLSVAAAPAFAGDKCRLIKKPQPAEFNDYVDVISAYDAFNGFLGNSPETQDVRVYRMPKSIDFERFEREFYQNSLDEIVSEAAAKTRDVKISRKQLMQHIKRSRAQKRIIKDTSDYTAQLRYLFKRGNVFFVDGPPDGRDLLVAGKNGYSLGIQGVPEAATRALLKVAGCPAK